MKVLYIESKIKNLNISIPKEEIALLPKKIFLAYTIQYKDLAKIVKKQLEESKITVTKFQQVLGCSKIKTTDPILLIGTGRFHSLNLFLQAPAVYLFQDNSIIKVPYHDIEALQMRKKTALIKFLNAKTIGILVSTKPGQNNLDSIEKVKQKLEKKGKEVYVFIANNLDVNQFENFNFIDSWVNSACPGIINDNPDILNIDDIPKV